MPTPQAILAESKINWRRAAPLLGDLLFIGFISIQISRRVGLSPHPYSALPDLPYSLITVQALTTLQAHFL